MSEKLFFGGDIITLEDELYAEALLIKSDKIEAVGDKADLMRIASSDVELVDLQGHTLMPSFMDAHSHFMGYAASFMQINLSDATCFNDISDAICDFIKKNNIKPGEWIQGDGYDHNFLCEKSHPTKRLLDEAAPYNPVVVKHKSGHMGVFNTMAIEQLGIEPSQDGYLEEKKYIQCVQRIPLPLMEAFAQSIRKAQEAYLSYGITTVQEGYVVEALAPILNHAIREGLIQLDLVAYLDVEKAEVLEPQFDCIKEYKNHVKIGGYKAFLDGSPQSRTAWMLSSYEGESDYYGVGTQSDEQLLKALQKAQRNGMQILIHCNGDAACEQYIQQLKLIKNGGELRPVMIHAQLLDTDQLNEMKSLGLIPSFFVAHVYHWGDIHVKNFGKERASRISMTKSALDRDILFTMHQDSPVIEPNMLETIWCAVNRITSSGAKLGEKEAITPLDAIKAVTKNVAFQYFEEDKKGTLKPGKLADLVILDKNPLKVAPMLLRDIKVLDTIKEGKSRIKIE